MQKKLIDAFYKVEDSHFQYKYKKSLKSVALDFFFERQQNSALLVTSKLQVTAFGKTIANDRFQSTYDLDTGKLQAKKHNEESLILPTSQVLDVNILPLLGMVLVDEKIQKVFLKKEEQVDLVFDQNNLYGTIKNAHVQFQYNAEGLLYSIQIKHPLVGKLNMDVIS